MAAAVTAPARKTGTVNGAGRRVPEGIQRPDGSQGPGGSNARATANGTGRGAETEPEIATEMEFSRIATYGFQRGGMSRFVLGGSRQARPRWSASAS